MLGSTPRLPLLAAVTRDLRAQLPLMPPPLFRELLRHLALLQAAPDAEFVEVGTSPPPLLC